MKIFFIVDNLKTGLRLGSLQIHGCIALHSSSCKTCAIFSHNCITNSDFITLKAFFSPATKFLIYLLLIFILSEDTKVVAPFRVAHPRISVI